jgi:dihydroneopterin aldolase
MRWEACWAIGGACKSKGEPRRASLLVDRMRLHMDEAIFIRGLRVHACHGMTSSEFQVERQFEIHLEIGTDLSLSSRTDCLSDTICYAAIVASVTDAFCLRRYPSLENGASAVAGTLLAGFPPISAIKITVRTACAPIGAVVEDVGVTMHVERSSACQGLLR